MQVKEPIQQGIQIVAAQIRYATIYLVHRLVPSIPNIKIPSSCTNFMKIKQLRKNTNLEWWRQPPPSVADLQKTKTMSTSSRN